MKTGLALAARGACSPGQQGQGPHSFGTFCRSVYAVPHGFAAVKFDADLDGRIFFSCRE